MAPKTECIDREVKTWCCISQGRSKLTCFFENNSYAPG